MTLPDAADIVIVGGGISGLSTALPLARAGRHVVILDKGESWSDASGANAGTLSVQVKRPEVLRLTRDAIKLWQRMKADYGIDVGFGQPGGIRVATNEVEVAYLERSVREQQGLGIEVELLTKTALNDFAPWLGPAVKAASFCYWDSYSSPLKAGNALTTGARALGVFIADNTAVSGIHFNGGMARGRYRIHTANGPYIVADHLIIAAGAWAGDIAAMVDARFPVEVDVNILTVTESAPALIDRVVTHAGGILSVKQYPNGTCLIGGGWQGKGSVKSGKKEIDYEQFVHNMRVAALVVPALEKLRIVRAWAGYEAVAVDALPVIGRLSGHDQAWVLACARGGYSQGPALGKALCEMILNPSKSSPYPQFSPQRFAA